jgi:FkbM family methyltransferase
MRIFVDIGGHYGETIDIALDPRYQFDRVLSFEPSQVCLKVLHRFKDPRVEVFGIALTNMNGPQELFGAGLLGASTRQKPYEGYSRREVVASVDAGAFLARCCAESDDIFLKMNCEGSEVEIIESLFESGFLSRVRSLFVEFDIVGILEEGESLRDKSEEFLKESSVSYIT